MSCPNVAGLSVRILSPIHWAERRFSSQRAFKVINEPKLKMSPVAHTHYKEPELL